MNQATLGRTGLKVSAAGLGCGGPSRLGLARGGSRAAAVALIHRAFALGVNVIDTAPAYGTEDVVGEAVRGRRDAAVVVTKVSPLDAASGTPAEPAAALRSVEESMRRLGMEYVDVLLLHAVGPALYRHSRDVLLPVLLRAREAGKCRAVGITEAYESDKGHTMLQSALEDDVWDVIMVALSAASPGAGEALLPRARHKNVGVIVMRPARDALAGGRSSLGVDMPDDPYTFCARLPGVHTVLMGTGNPAHLEGNLRAFRKGPDVG